MYIENVDDFDEIANGNNFLQIIENKNRQNTSKYWKFY